MAELAAGTAPWITSVAAQEGPMLGRAFAAGARGSAGRGRSCDLRCKAGADLEWPAPGTGDVLAGGLFEQSCRVGAGRGRQLAGG